MREALLFCFNLKKSAIESHRMLVEVYGFIGNNMQRLVSPVQWRQFWSQRQEAFKSAQEGWELSIASSFGRGQYPIAKNVCRAIRCFSSSHFHAATSHGEDSKIGKWVPHELNDRQMEWHQNTCQILLAKKESRFCIGLWQAMKSGSIFRILNARNLGLIPPNH